MNKITCPRCDGPAFEHDGIIQRHTAPGSRERCEAAGTAALRVQFTVLPEPETPYPFGLTRREIDADPFGLDPFDRSRPRALDTLGVISEGRLVTRLGDPEPRDPALPDRDKRVRQWKTILGPIGWHEPLFANAALFWRAGLLDAGDAPGPDEWRLVELTEVGELVMRLWLAQGNAENARPRGSLSHRARAAIPEVLYWLKEQAEGDQFPVAPSLEQTITVLAEGAGVKDPYTMEAEWAAKLDSLFGENS